MTTLLLTVRYSGVNFLGRFLTGDLGLDGKGYVASANSGADFCHAHPDPDLELDIENYDAVIVTLRHPLLSAQSSKRKGGKASEIVAEWLRVVELAERAGKLLFFDVDCDLDNRRPQLQMIADHFGKGHMTEAIDRLASNWDRVSWSINDDDIEISQLAIEKYKQWRP